MIKYLKPHTAMKLISYWPPYWGAGIKVIEANQDLTYIKVQMKLKLRNTNYVGTHFGGSLYSMCDPFFMFMFLHHMREEHIVWDKAASIEFVKPGKGIVSVEFRVTQDDIEKAKAVCLENFKYEPTFDANVIDEKGEVVARVKKKLYFRRKDAKTRFTKVQ
jgi:acyl-coenzyme A thioesterase PaaI-like protein